MAMAGQRENNEVNPRPDHRTVSMWKDVERALECIRQTEFLLGLLPEKPRSPESGWFEVDIDAIEMQLFDARRALGELALALSTGGES